MADLPDTHDANHDLDREVPPSTPRWVYLFGLVVLILILLFVTLHLSGGGMRMHGGHTPASTVTEQSVPKP